MGSIRLHTYNQTLHTPRSNNHQNIIYYLLRCDFTLVVVIAINTFKNKKDEKIES